MLLNTVSVRAGFVRGGLRGLTPVKETWLTPTEDPKNLSHLWRVLKPEICFLGHPVNIIVASSTPEVFTDDEFDSHLLMSNNSSDVLQFWDEHRPQLPKMAYIARKL